MTTDNHSPKPKSLILLSLVLVASLFGNVLLFLKYRNLAQKVQPFVDMNSQLEAAASQLSSASGQIIAVDGQTVTVKDVDRTIQFSLNETTQIYLSSQDGQTPLQLGTVSQLKTGQTVNIFGQKKSDDLPVAETIVVVNQ